MSYMYVWRKYVHCIAMHWWHIYTHGFFFAGNCGIILVHGLGKLIKPWFSLIHATPSFKPAFHRDETKKCEYSFPAKKTICV